MKLSRAQTDMLTILVTEEGSAVKWGHLRDLGLNTPRRTAAALIELKLVERTLDADRIFLSVTPAGRRALVREILLQEQTPAHVRAAERLFACSLTTDDFRDDNGRMVFDDIPSPFRSNVYNELRDREKFES